MSSDLSSAPPARTPPWLWPGLIVLPFLGVLAFLLASGRVFPVFWGNDEMEVHWVLMEQFARQLPWIDLNYGGSATTPLFHLLGGGFMRLFGPHLQIQRALNALVSLGGVLALYDTLRRPLRHSPAGAALLAAIVGASCYFFGYSFRLLTDNVALVCCILAVRQLCRFTDPAGPRSLTSYLWGCGWCALAVLTRQNYVFLCLPFTAALWWSRLPVRSKLAGTGGLALAMLPFGALAVYWGGLVPPALHSRHSSGFLHFYSLGLAVAVLGVYSVFFSGPTLLREVLSGQVDKRRWALPLLAAAAGLAAATLPLMPASALHQSGGQFGGWLYTVAGKLPKLRGNSVLFWVLLPCGCAAAAHYGRGLLPSRDRMDAGGTNSSGWQGRTAALFLFGLLFSSLLNAVAAQKYYDGTILLFQAWAEQGEPARDPWRRTGLIALLLMDSLYYVAACVLPPLG